MNWAVPAWTDPSVLQPTTSRGVCLACVANALSATHCATSERKRPTIQAQASPQCTDMMGRGTPSAACTSQPVQHPPAAALSCSLPPLWERWGPIRCLRCCPRWWIALRPSSWETTSWPCEYSVPAEWEFQDPLCAGRPAQLQHCSHVCDRPPCGPVSLICGCCVCLETPA